MVNQNEYEVMIGNEYADDDGATGLIHSPNGMPQQFDCPDCGGLVVWAEAGYVPGTRKCVKCGSMFHVSVDKDSKARCKPGERAAYWRWQRERFF